jgi:hypothetical protein
MNDYRQNINYNIDMFQDSLANISSHIPAILGFLLYLVVAFISYKLLVFLVIKLLGSLHFERLFPEKLSSRIDIDPTVILLGFFRFGLLLIFFILGAEILGLQVITQELGVLLAFLPRLLMAIAFFVLGLSVSKTITRVVFSLLDAMGLSGARIISRLAGLVILFVIGVMAMELVGIDTAIITTNISIILGSLMICVAIAIGLGSVEIVKRILFGFYFRKNFQIGQVIRFEDVSGRIVKMDNISITIEQEDSKLVIPIRDLVDRRVAIYE